MIKTIPKTAREFALKHKISLGRNAHGHFTIRDRNRKVVEMSIQPTAQSALVMMKKYVKAPPPKYKRNPSSGVKIVHNKLLGGWYVVHGPHHTPISGVFSSKADAENFLNRPKSATVKYKRNPSTIRFKDLSVGDVFEFDHTGLPIASGIANGPWVKISALRYHHVNNSEKIVRVGSANVQVIKSYRRNPSSGFSEKQILEQARVLSELLGVPLQVEKNGVASSARYKVTYMDGARALSKSFTAPNMEHWFHGSIASAALTAEMLD